MDLDSMVSNVGAALFVIGLFITMAGFFIEKDRIRDMGILLAVVGISCLVVSASLL